MSITTPNFYTKFRPHVDRLKFDHPLIKDLPKAPKTQQDYDNCKVIADYIAYQILGMLDEDGNKKLPVYWNNPEEFPEFKDLKPLEIEIKIIRDQGRDNYGELSEYGQPIYVHALMIAKMLFPKTDITPVLADIFELFFGAFTYGRKYLHLLGSQDSGKSSTIARLIFVCMLIDPKHTFAPVASPFVNTSETIIWGDILELYAEIVEAHPLDDTNIEVSSIFPKATVVNGRVNFTASKNGKAGWAKIVNLKKGGKLIGTKNVGSDPRVGIGIIAFDEINRAENTGFEGELSNVGGQDWFQFVSAQNPLDEDDVGGQFATPKIWNGWGISSFDELREQKPTIYPTVKSGIAYRLDGLDSVNMKLGKTIYVYQFNHKKHQRLLDDYGESSPAYMSQARALFSGEDANKRLLSQSRLSASKHEEDDFIMTEIKDRVLFCDPAHTGEGDQAAISWSEFGKGIVTLTDGSQEEKHLIVYREPIEYVKYVNNFIWKTDLEHPDSNFERRFVAVGGDMNKITVGSKISYEQQIAIRMAEIAKEKGIPFRNIGFDFSMRYEMVQAVTLVMGHDCVAFDYNTKAIGYHLESTKQNTEEKCPQRNGRTYELGYLASDVITSKQLRGGHNIRVALIQTCKTRILTDKPYEPFEKKADYKARNENKSPDERDAWFGNIGMAFLRGFRTDKLETSSGVKSSSIFRKALKNNRFKSKTIKKL